jgi:hypothetical protein
MDAIENHWSLVYQSHSITMRRLNLNESENETAEVEINLQLSMQEKLARAIDKEMNSKISSKSRTTKDVTSIVKKELAISAVNGKRAANLESCYENLNSIPTSSVEPDGIFSGCGRTVTTTRSSLHDESWTC